MSEKTKRRRLSFKEKYELIKEVNPIEKTHVGTYIESLTGSYVGRHTGTRIGFHGNFGQGTHVGSRIGIYRGSYVGTCAMDYMTT